jgi:pyruvate dehydrogenase E2 component (dihydrolipoamide acetyltransferase)
VRADEPLLEVETDKVTTEIPAIANGVLKAILVEPGTTVPVGTVLAVIEPASK